MGRLNHSITGTGCDTLIKHLIIINTLSWTSERDKEDFIGNELDFSNNCWVCHLNTLILIKAETRR